MSSDLVERHPDSGVHDIRKLAEQHKAMAEAAHAARDDRESTPLGHVVPPVVVMPIKAVRSTPRWVWIAVPVGVLLLGGVGVLATLLLRTNGASAKVAAAALPTAAQPQADVPAPSPVARASVLAAQPAADPAAAPAGAEPSAAGKTSSQPKIRAGRAASAASAPAAAHEAHEKSAPAPALGKSDEPVAPKAAPKPHGDELDQLLAESVAEGARAKAALTPTEEGLLPEAPSREAITAAMGKIKPRIQGCYEKYQKAGIVNISLGIAKTGHVTSALATGKFADSDTGRCVTSAVKTALFPRFRGPAIKIDYPFMLTAQ